MISGRGVRENESARVANGASRSMLFCSARTFLRQAEGTWRRRPARVLCGARQNGFLEVRAALRARETPEKLAQDAFRTAREKLAQERSELAQTLADASAKPSQDT